MSDTAQLDPASPLQEDATGACENCGTPLQGTYCYACGQSRHNPTRHLGHAIEDVFESIWHLDGRIFRTLRDLLVPGRVAIDYLAGHRARYVAPFRLFVILSLLTFFIASLSTDIDPDTAIRLDGDSDISQAETVAEVERRRDEAIAALESRRGELAEQAPVAAAAIDTAVSAARSQADARIAELREASPATDDTPGAEVPATRGKKPGRDEEAGAWDAKANPIAIAWLPGFANDWLNTQSDRASHNVLRIRDDPERFVGDLIGAIPTTLIFLVPLFALLLKLAYLFTGRLYLEHLVVALYSHAYLLLSLLLIFVASAIRGALPAGASGLGVVFGLVEAGLWAWMPVYLLLMQRRVYRQGWPMTLLKYTVMGVLYFMLLGFGAAFLFTYVLVKM
ncbi:DUF3667 domain-containing protein [Luteimonas vadosa]|uniref:DUF3667 domain-containing protein n=1 Tax=Luteimonas vadosa TaxID=1165507 RepID=A0ABP9DPF1_9GAMM